MALATKLHFKMVTPSATVFEQDVEGVSLPTVMGEITVLPEHTELVSILTPGELVVRADGKTSPLAVTGGVIEMYNNTLYILADAAEHVDDIDVIAAEKRAQQLEQDLKERTDLDLTSYSLLQRNLEMERIKLNLTKKWRKQ